jgi:AI-2 transport protein TqsA
MRPPPMKPFAVPRHFYFLVSGAIVMAFLVLAQSFLIPLAIAILFWGLLNELIAQLCRIRIGPLGLPHWAAVIVAIGIVLFGNALFFFVLSTEAGSIADSIPRYASQFQGLFGRLISVLGQDIAAEGERALSQLAMTSGISEVVGTAGTITWGMVLVAIYVGFLLADQHNLPRKLAALFPSADRADEIERVFFSINKNVRRYVWIQTVVSVLTAAASYVLLKVLGVNFAATWALLIFLLNYIPSIGSVLGVVFPALFALLQFGTLALFLIVTGGLTAIQFVIGNILQPVITGRSLNVSSFVVILSLTFWGAVWGIVGMFLAVPLTVVCMIVCAHLPDWRWVAIMLSADGTIEPPPEQSGGGDLPPSEP